MACSYREVRRQGLDPGPRVAGKVEAGCRVRCGESGQELCSEQRRRLLGFGLSRR